MTRITAGTLKRPVALTDHHLLLRGLLTGVRVSVTRGTPMGNVNTVKKAATRPPNAVGNKCLLWSLTTGQYFSIVPRSPFFFFRLDAPRGIDRDVSSKIG